MREGFEELNNVVQSLTGIFRHKPTAPSCSKPWFFQHFGGGIFLTHSSPNLLSEISLQQYTFPSFLNLGISTNTHYSPNSPYSKLGFVSAVSWQVLRVDTPSQWRVFMYSAWIQDKKKKKVASDLLPWTTSSLWEAIQKGLLSRVWRALSPWEIYTSTMKRQEWHLDMSARGWSAVEA